MVLARREGSNAGDIIRRPIALSSNRPRGAQLALLNRSRGERGTLQGDHT
jgi:hypothetical protein